MAAVTGPGMGGSVPGAPRQGKRRRWLTGVVVAWIVVLTGAALWSVGHDPATVAEQRGIGVAVDELQKAAGVVFAAADGDGRAVALGELRVVGGCRITPVRHGEEATRDLNLYVRDGDARATLEEIAAALPAGYRAEVTTGRAATRLSFHADAGDFVGIDTDATAAAKVLTLRLSTGCRPPATVEPARSGPPAGPAPRALTETLAALAAPAAAPSVQSIACPGGGVAATYTVDGIATPADVWSRLKAATTAATVFRSDASAWAYRVGGDSVLVLPEEKQLRVSVTTSC